MGQILIGYATRTGAAADIATAMAETFYAMGHKVRIANLDKDPDVQPADLVVIGSGINAGSWYPEATGWLRRNAEALSATRVAVFNTCMNAVDPAKRESAIAYNDAVAEQCGAVASTSFGGRYVPAKAGLFSRILAKATGQKAEDHVDPAAAREWAGRLLPLVTGA